MGRDSAPKNMYSIYKIDPAKVIDAKIIGSKSESLADYRPALISYLETRLRSKSSVTDFIAVQQYGLMGFVYKHQSKSPWAQVVAELVATDNHGYLLHRDEAQGRVMPSGFTYNSQLSFALFDYSQSNIYAVSCGLGHHCFKQFVLPDFGITFISKLIEEDSAAIRSMTSSTPTGLRISESHINRNVIAYHDERDIDSICDSLGLELDEKHLASLALEVRTDKYGKPKRTSADAKCTLKIKRSITLKKLDLLIQKLAEIDQLDANFALSSFQKISDKELSQLLEDELIKNIQHGELGYITITGDEPERYYFGEHFSVRNLGDYNLCIGETPIDIHSLVEDLRNTYGLDDTVVRKMMTHSILAIQYEAGKHPHSCKLREAMTASVQYKMNSFYLLWGEWYKFSAESKQYIDDQFDRIQVESQLKANEIVHNFNLAKELYSVRTESQYNRALYANEKVVVSDTVCERNVEIADVICFSNDNLILFHNKQRFNGKGSRDVTHQIETSSFVLHAALSSSDHRDEFVQRLYYGIKAKYQTRSADIPVGLDEFRNWFRPSNNITYVSAYLQDMSSTRNSQYAKYTTIATSKRLADYGYKMYVAIL